MDARMLEGQAALVTGASGGIGSETARRLAKAGAKVALHYNANAKAAEAVAEEIRAAGGEAITVGGDVAKEADATAIAGAVAKAFGKIDILVNNAGTLQSIPFGQVTEANFHEQFGANVLGAILMMQACAAHFPAEVARVVNMSTNIAYQPIEGIVVYSAAKGAMIQVTQGFARELGKRGVSVNAVAPGGIDTAMTSWLSDDMRQGIVASTPLGRFGQPADVADVILFLASPQARWVTGRTLIVDGGLI